jgi:hypothetical protein
MSGAAQITRMMLPAARSENHEGFQNFIHVLTSPLDKTIGRWSGSQLAVVVTAAPRIANHIKQR